MARKEDNLIPGGHKFTLEEASKGGKNSAETRRQRKAFKEVFDNLLTGGLSQEFYDSLNSVTKDDLNVMGIDATELTVADYIGLAQVLKAMKGDTTAFVTIRDTVGEKPADKQEHKFEDMPDITLVKSKCTKKSK